MYIYVTRDFKGGWCRHKKDIPGTALVSVSTINGTRVLYSRVPDLASREQRFRDVHDFMNHCSPDLVKDVLVKESRAKLLTIFENDVLYDWGTLGPLMEHYVAWEDALHELVREGVLRYGSDAKGFGFKKTETPVPPTCITPNGRTDGHCEYVKTKNGQTVCYFCEKP